MTDFRHRPAVLYKYRNLSDWTKELLSDRALYLPSINEINDPFDCCVLLDRTASHRFLWKWTKKSLAKVYGKLDEVELVRRWLSEPNHFGPSFGEAEAKEYLRKKRWRELNPNNQSGRDLIMGSRRDNIRMYCLSERNNEILMWSHYGQNHHGICLGFDIDSNPVFAKTSPVRYVRSYPRANYYRVSDDDYYAFSLLTKAELWTYEKEWRLLLTRGVKGKKAVHHFPSGFLKELIFGCQATESERAQVLEWLELGGLSPTLYETVPAESDYELSVRKL